jgi:hypothetical protein
MTEEPDPDAISPTSNKPLPATGPLLTGPYPLDPAAPSSANQMPVPGKGMTKLPAVSRSASSSKSTIPNRTTWKPSSTGAKPLAAFDATTQSSLVDDETQALLSSQMGDDKEPRRLPEE